VEFLEDFEAQMPVDDLVLPVAMAKALGLLKRPHDDRRIQTRSLDLGKEFFLEGFRRVGCGVGMGKKGGDGDFGWHHSSQLKRSFQRSAFSNQLSAFDI